MAKPPKYLYKYPARSRNKESALEKLLGNPITLIVIFLSLGASVFPVYFHTFDYLIVGLTIILILLVIGSLFLLWYIRSLEDQKLKAIQLADVDHMTGIEFEKYVGKLLQFQGYKIRFTPQSGDFGVDIVATRGNDRMGVQVKRRSRPLDQEPIRAVKAGIVIEDYYCNKAMVVTNNYFTQSAQKLAQANHCELVDRDQLTEWIYKFQKQK